MRDIQRYTDYEIQDLHESLTPSNMFSVQVDAAREQWPTSVQERQFGALRAFYDEAADLHMVDELPINGYESMVLVTTANMAEILEFLRSPKAFIGFHPAIVEDNGQLWLTY